MYECTNKTKTVQDKKIYIDLYVYNHLHNICMHKIKQKLYKIKIYIDLNVLNYLQNIIG